MIVKKEVDIEIYKYENILKVKKIFEKYIKVSINKIKKSKIEILFEGENSDIYSKEFFNYLIFEESRME